VTDPVGAVIGAHLEHPDVLPPQREFPVQGWVTSRVPVRGVFVDGRDPAPLELRHRPDVVKAMPDAPHASGFFGIARQGHLSSGALALRFVFDDSSVIVRFAPSREGDAVLEARAARRARVLAVLRCLRCERPFSSSAYSPDMAALRCDGCGATYDCSQGPFDMLPDEARAPLSLGNDGNISQNAYDPFALSFVNEDPGALVLDCGAGLRKQEHRNVVNLEVVPYRSTDVLADNERLPFVDGAFDGVMSLAVLEHVQNPFAAASELCRVLKPGGKLIAVVPLLQPVHAYPHHYFNMTAEGLARLFSERIDIVERSVPASGLPIWALTWILRSWAEGLPEATRASFLDQRVGDLLGEGHEYLARDFVTELPREKNFELAATTMIVGTKRG